MLLLLSPGDGTLYYPYGSASVEYNRYYINNFMYWEAVRPALMMLADGKVDPRPLITGTVGLDGVEGAFDALGDAERHAKILIDPRA